MTAVKKAPILAFFGIIMLTLAAPAALAVTPVEVEVPDTALNQALHDKLGTAYDEPLLDTQLGNLSGALNLSGKGIADLTGLEHVTGVSALDLSDNTISQVPDAFCAMLRGSAIRQLDLSGNGLSGLPDSIADSRLISLDLSLNGLFSVPAAVTEITTLETLNLSGNKLGRLPSALTSMASLKTLLVEANRLTELPSAFRNLSADTFSCNYNFLDLTAEAGNQAILDAMEVDTLRYEDQLRPISGLTVTYPAVGTAQFSWDPCEDIDFGGGVTARVARTSVLQSSAYVGAADPDETTFTLEGLTVGKTYKFQLSWDYKIAGTPYSDMYTKCYLAVETVPGENPSPAATATLAPTASPAPSEAPSPAPSPSPAGETASPTATPLPETPKPSVTAATPGATEAPASGEGLTAGVPTTVVVLLAVVIVLLLVALGIVVVYLFNRR